MASPLSEGPITFEGQRDKYIGLALAISSSLAIGTSFILTKKGLISAADRHDGLSSDSYSYLTNGMWWAGMILMVVGEVANFAAYTFAPPILVTPLGALSVLIGAILAALFLGERLGKIGLAGCSLCGVGSVIIVLHAPEDRVVETVDEVLAYALQPGFMLYCSFVLAFSLYQIYVVAPRSGSKNPLVYISVCSLVGSVSVMAVKGFGVALKLTFAGNNQLWRGGTWIFAFTVVGCIAVQMNYFNKALDLFPTTVVNPSYFVGFSTSTIIASIILFHGLNTTGGSNTVSLLCGLYVISLGVYLLNISRSSDHSAGDGTRSNRHSLLESGILGSRMSQSNRLSMGSDSDPDGGVGGGVGVGGGMRHSREVNGGPGRNSAGFYRGGGAVVGGVEPLFDYEEEPALPLRKLPDGGPGKDRRFIDEDDEDDEDAEEAIEDERHPALPKGVTRGESW